MLKSLSERTSKQQFNHISSLEQYIGLLNYYTLMNYSVCMAFLWYKRQLKHCYATLLLVYWWLFGTLVCMYLCITAPFVQFVGSHWFSKLVKSETLPQSILTSKFFFQGKGKTDNGINKYFYFSCCIPRKDISAQVWTHGCIFIYFFFGSPTVALKSHITLDESCFAQHDIKKFEWPTVFHNQYGFSSVIVC